jgi:hypothetical protein
MSLTEKEQELKPCPFCGGKADYFYNTDPAGCAFDITVSCTNPKCWFCVTGNQDNLFPPLDSFEEARELWNRRAAPPWTYEKPTKKGWYWYIDMEVESPELVSVYDGIARFVNLAGECTDDMALELLHGRWHPCIDPCIEPPLPAETEDTP